MAARGMLITIALQRAVASISGTGRTRTKKTTVMTMAAMTDLAQLDTSLRGDKRLYQKSVGASTCPETARSEFSNRERADTGVADSERTLLELPLRWRGPHLLRYNNRSYLRV
jgi:hypothetical protein